MLPFKVRELVLAHIAIHCAKLDAYIHVYAALACLIVVECGNVVESENVIIIFHDVTFQSKNVERLKIDKRDHTLLSA